MPGERDLKRLLQGMEPVLAAVPYGFVVNRKDAPLPAGLRAFALITEAEGTTIVAPASDLQQAGFAAGGLWAHISLTIHSDLAAVGLTAAISSVLAASGISANIIAGYYHDHVFLPWDQRQLALRVLQELAGSVTDV